MTWAKVDTLVRSHRKIQKAIRAVGNANAVWLWHCGNLYCRDVLSDGFIDDEIVSTLAPGLAEKAIAPLPAVLVTVGLWARADGGYLIHDFLDHNPSKDDIDAGREWDRRRKSLYADKDLIRAIRDRDADCCRYCGRSVNWRDRRGDGGGQFDHVVPRGENSFENVVVACRKCNYRKGARTPAEAGMHLRLVTSSELVTDQVKPSNPHAGAGARSSASSSDSPEVLGSLEGGPGETAPPVPAGREGVMARYRSLHGQTTLDWDRQHRTHALRGDLCGSFVCLPESVFADWLRRLVNAGATPDQAKADILAWALSVRARWANSPTIPGDDNFAFWRNEWQATHGSNRPSSAPKPGAGLDALIGGSRG